MEEKAEVMVYSKLLKKPFETLEELQEAEKKYHEENDAKLKLVEEKKSRAKEIEDAYKHSMDVRKQAQKMIKEADNKYYELRNKFVKDYGSYHLSYYNNDGKEFISFSDMMDSFFRMF